MILFNLQKIFCLNVHGDCTAGLDVAPPHYTTSAVCKIWTLRTAPKNLTTYICVRAHLRFEYMYQLSKLRAYFKSLSMHESNQIHEIPVKLFRDSHENSTSS